MSDISILFVDNSRTTRATMQKILEKQGYIVETVASGAEAIERLQQEGSNYNLIVMDLFMPAMNGYEAARLIRELPDDANNQIPIIALSASSDQKDIDIAKSSGMNQFVVKSSNHQELFSAIQEHGRS